MPAVVLGPVGSVRPQFFDDQGNVLAGGFLYFYLAQTSTPQATYTTSAGSSLNTNPIELDADGRAPNGIWFIEGSAYKITATDADGNLLWTEDNVRGMNDVSETQDQWVASGLTPTYVSATSFTLSGDQTTAFHVGRRLKTANSGGTVYSTILTSSFAAGTTTITVANDSGTLDALLSAVSYGLLSADNPSVPWPKIAVNLAGIISPTQLAANTDNWTPIGIATANTIRFSTDARRNVTGLSGGTTGRTMVLHNVGTFPAVFKYENSNSDSGNRFAFGLTLGGGQSIELQYDLTSTRWRLKSAPPDAVGMLRDFSGGTVPEGYLACDGSNVSRTTYAALFNEISTTWGVGDGVSTFGLPDFRRRVAVGSGGSGSATLANTVGSTGGEETHTMTTSELVQHLHDSGTLAAAESAALTTGAAGGLANAAQGNTGDAQVTIAVSGSTANTGSSTPFNVIQPSAVVTKVIKF